MGRYLLKPKTYHKFKTQGLDLRCKICGVPLQIGDEVESKSGGNRPKFYHAECYDDFHLDFEEDNDEENEDE